MNSFDIIVIGAGIAGASIAAHLSGEKSVLILEMEERAGYHTTGRSAASYEPNYGPPPMLAFTRASAWFFNAPPKGFTDASILSPRPSLFFMPGGQEEAAEQLLANSSGLDEVSESRAIALFPVLRKGHAKRSFLDNATGDMDVDLLHRGYLRLFKERGGQTQLSAEVTTIEKAGGAWHLTTKHGTYSAPIIVNAAGAWGDVLAARAGIAPIGLQPKRRSIGVVPVTDHPTLHDWPLVTDVGETWYAKPQSGKLIVSSADATHVEPHDAFADDLAIAEGVERLMNATTIEVERLDHSWGGLRTFAPDRHPVVGFDPSTEGFFWLVGQGGYGIQSAPALSETAAAMVLRKPIPALVIDKGLHLPHILPERLR